MKTPASCVLALCFASGAAAAADCLPSLRDGWMRLPPAQMPMAAAFGELRNDCAEPITVVSASSPAFGSVELHETRVVDGVSRMRHVPELRVAPGETATLRPGGVHLMLMRPQASLRQGDTVSVALELADGRRVPATFEVRDTAGR